MSFLTQEQKDTFWQTGFLVITDAVTTEELEGLRNVFSCWVEESREYKSDYGETLDGRPRFDLQPGHSAEKPGLRRIQSPEEVSDLFANIMRNAATVDFCAELIGPCLLYTSPSPRDDR